MAGQAKWYGIRKGHWLLIKEAKTLPKMIKSKIVIPRLPTSPSRDMDGEYNYGYTFSQIDWEGGELIGIIPYSLFENKTDKYVSRNTCVELKLQVKSTVKRILSAL